MLEARHPIGASEILTNQPGADSWPITGASFILMHKEPQDPTAALPFLQRAAEANQPEALHMLATLYRDGVGAPRSNSDLTHAGSSRLSAGIN